MIQGKGCSDYTTLFEHVILTSASRSTCEFFSVSFYFQPPIDTEVDTGMSNALAQRPVQADKSRRGLDSCSVHEVSREVSDWLRWAERLS